MEYFPWWNEAQKKLADDAKKIVDEVLIPIGEKCAWKKEFPWEAVKIVADLGWFGAQVPAKYGGRLEEWGVTGACIILEETYRAAMVSAPLTVTMIGGVHQILHDGTEEQKQRWAPQIAKGKMLGAIVMTEPYAGSDIAAIETTGVRDGDDYILNGKKRFQTLIGPADMYMTYVRTSNKPEDVAKYKHLTAFVVEKGTPGFTVERVNDLIGFDGIQNGYLSFDNVRVPAANRLGPEGAGWQVMMSGLNVERICSAAGAIGMMRECLRYSVQHLQRRVQGGRPTGDIMTNQFKVADIISRLQVGRLLTYYAAYCADIGREVPLEAGISKMITTDDSLQTAIDAIQCMGGNGVTKLYPVERLYRDAKMWQIAGGTNEVLKLLTYRQGLKGLMPDLKVPVRVIDEELGVPLPVGRPPAKKTVTSEDDVLAVLAEEYMINPGLHMSMEDLKERLNVTDTDLTEHLRSLANKGLAGLFADKRGRITLARVTYEGLAHAHGSDYYRHIPSWVNPNDIF